MQERHAIEREVLTFLAALPGAREQYQKAGVDLSWFEDPIHQRVYSIIAGQEGVITDVVIHQRGAPNWESVPYTQSIEALMETFQNVVFKTNMDAVFGEIINKQGEPALIFAELIHAVQSLETFVRRPTGPSSLLEGLDDIWKQYLLRKEKQGITGLPYPWKTVNTMTGGINAEELVVFYGLPKAMKTWLWMWTAKNIWLNCKVPISLTSREMGRDIIKRRWLASCACLHYGRFVQGNLTQAEEQNLCGTMDFLKQVEKDAPIYYPEIRGYGLEAIADLERHVKEAKPSIVFVDALNTLGVKWEQITEATRALKRLCKDTGIPIVGTAQANRKLERRNVDDATPEQDMGGSLSFVQDCDVLVRTTKIGEDKLNLTLAAMRECPEEAIILQAFPAIEFREMDVSSLKTSDIAEFMKEVQKPKRKAKGE